jgi:hypothetical protein
VGDEVVEIASVLNDAGTVAHHEPVAWDWRDERECQERR